MSAQVNIASNLTRVVLTVTDTAQLVSALPYSHLWIWNDSDTPFYVMLTTKDSLTSPTPPPTFSGSTGQFDFEIIPSKEPLQLKGLSSDIAVWILHESTGNKTGRALLLR